MKTDLFKFELDLNLSSREEVYQYLTELISADKSLTKSFLAREAVGNIQIAERVVLPHLVLPDVENSIIILRTQEMIPKWSDLIGEVQVIVTLLMNSQANEKEKTAFDDFLRKLMDPSFVNLLFTAREQELENYLS